MMKRKKITTIILSFVALFLFAGCNFFEEQIQRKEALLAIQGKGNHYFIDEEGYIKDNERVYFSDLIMDKIETDGEVSVPKPDKSQTKRYDVDAKILKDTVYFTMRYRISEDDKVADVIVGYIDIRSKEITYYNTQISTREEYGINLLPIMANDNYFLFRQPREFSRKDVYYIIDKNNNVLLEKVSDITPYKDGTEDDANLIEFNDKTYEINGNALHCGEETIAIDYEYVLLRSEEMKQIDEIIGNYKKSTSAKLISYEDRVYVVMESVLVGMPFATGELIPIIFEYDVQTDSFDYIGATDLTQRTTDVSIFGIIPES